jgi:hypothetical protein
MKFTVQEATINVDALDNLTPPHLKIAPATTVVKVGQKLTLEVFVDSPDQVVGTGGPFLVFDSNILDLVADESSTNAAGCDLWAGPVKKSAEGLLSFLCQTTKGWEGTDIFLGKIVFIAKKPGEALLQWDLNNTALLDAPGVDRPMKFTHSGASISVTK